MRLLNQAQNRKCDEFYTQYIDIELEMLHYYKQFQNKIIYCNCDDYQKSNFYKYFSDNFFNFQLNKLICTCYQKDKQGYGIIKTKDSTEHIQLKENGDFRSKECLDILKRSDIIISNPPFSLLNEYIQLLVNNEKKFIILGNINCLIYKNIFILYKNHKIQYGLSINSGDREFRVPKDYKIFSKYREDQFGNRYVRISGVCWLTNIRDYSTYTNIKLTKEYISKNYIKYNNYDAINIDKCKNIPKDYNGIMGVPIGFLRKYNPNQFEIIDYRKGNDNKDLNYNIIDIDGNQKIITPYIRILIRKLESSN